MRYLSLIIICFVVFCGWLVVESGLFECSAPNSGPCILLQSATGNENNSAANVPSEEPPQIGANDSINFRADNVQAQTVMLGAADPPWAVKI